MPFGKDLTNEQARSREQALRELRNSINRTVTDSRRQFDEHTMRQERRYGGRYSNGENNGSYSGNEGSHWNDR